MKNIYLILAILLLNISCQEDSPKKETASGICADSTSKDCQLYLVGSQLVSVVNGKPALVTADGIERDEWDDFELTLTYDSVAFAGTYSILGVPPAEGAETLWGLDNTSGSWSFNDSGTAIHVGDISRDIEISQYAISLAFSVSHDDSRTGHFATEWEFTWTK